MGWKKQGGFPLEKGSYHLGEFGGMVRVSRMGTVYVRGAEGAAGKGGHLRRAAPDFVDAEERQSAWSMQSCGNWKVCSACRYRCSLLGAGRSAYMLPTHVPAARAAPLHFWAGTELEL